MSTHRLRQKRQKSSMLPTFSLIGGLLIVLQLWTMFPSGVQAAATNVGKQSSVALPAENVTRAGVDVVRLLVSYTTTGTNSIQKSELCTGLGTLVDSTLVSEVAPARSHYVNWVLTDGKLVNGLENKALCGNGNGESNVTLASIAIYPSNAYNPQEPPFYVSSFDVSSTGNLHCLDTVCENGPVLFSFNTDHPQPFIDPIPSGGDHRSLMGLELTGKQSDLPTLRSISGNADSKTSASDLKVSEFLIPGTVAQADTRLEAGTPLINNHGELAGIYLSGNNSIGTMDDMGNFLNTIMVGPLSNQVHDYWRAGMDDLYKQQFVPAKAAFTTAYNANEQFVAAKKYSDLAAQSAKDLTKSAGAGTKSIIGSAGDSFMVGNISIPFWLVSIVGLAIVVLLLLILSIIVNRARKERRQEEELEQTATVDAQRIAQLEALQRASRLAQPAQPVQPAAPIQFSPVQSDGKLAASGVVPEWNCPQCGEPIVADAHFCSNCRLALSPSESGLHLRVKPLVSRASAVAPLAEQPTLVPAGPGAFVDQPTLVPGLIAQQEVDEQPTIELPPNIAPVANGSEVGGVGGVGGVGEVKNPYAVQQIKGRNLGFVVGTRSDPGIKRKYKPNEDSLFAAQGLLTGVETQPLFGLFVVADGMGGHANGEDASQLAIQTIIDKILPKLKQAGPGSAEDYAGLLVEGIQSANQAVHTSNVEQGGDMGTTVTAAMVVGGYAYVANVGDSRTYLYRESEGLKKVTNDHSVVASLVEAGIIKPDDIYTHPKRNQIYRSLGEKAAVEIDHFIVQLQEGDKLLLCSDGLWDMVRDPKIEEVVKNATPSPNDTGDALIQAALASGGEDNVSVIVVHITGIEQASGVRSVQLLAKPESVQMPQL